MTLRFAGATAGSGLVDGTRELIEHLRAQAATMVELVRRPHASRHPRDLVFGIQGGVDEHSKGGVALVSNTDADNVIHHGLE